ncbi:MAG: cobaltochelatase subunit CobN, partial [Methanothrix harundinacea]|nr:cobaltochelatase subunit CobN [Methanothrix harundinacea]
SPQERSWKRRFRLLGDTRYWDRVAVRSLADEVGRIVRAKLLSPKWVEEMKRHGYKGAGNISKIEEGLRGLRLGGNDPGG